MIDKNDALLEFIVVALIAGSLIWLILNLFNLPDLEGAIALVLTSIPVGIYLFIHYWGRP